MPDQLVGRCVLSRVSSGLPSGIFSTTVLGPFIKEEVTRAGCLVQITNFCPGRRTAFMEIPFQRATALWLTL